MARLAGLPRPRAPPQAVRQPTQHGLGELLGLLLPAPPFLTSCSSKLLFLGGLRLWFLSLKRKPGDDS